MTPFHNIAVWSAVKFVDSPVEGGAAFLPLITDPENIDRSSLFVPLRYFDYIKIFVPIQICIFNIIIITLPKIILSGQLCIRSFNIFSASDKRRLSSGLHAPIFAVVMRSLCISRQLECHAFVCQSAEDAIVIAATLYQSLMSHMGSSKNKSSRKPRNQNGVSCISIASSSNHLGSVNNMGRQHSANSGIKQKISQFNPPRPPRKKRNATSSLSGLSDNTEPIEQPSVEERKKKSHKTRKAPPIPSTLKEG